MFANSETAMMNSVKAAPAITPRDRLLEAVRKELVEFERRENEFRRKDREERAAELRLAKKARDIR
jgi:hypothetical protein